MTFDIVVMRGAFPRARLAHPALEVFGDEKSPRLSEREPGGVLGMLSSLEVKVFCPT